MYQSSLQNCVLTPYNGNSFGPLWPYNPPSTTTVTYLTPMVSIDKAANGFIVTKDGQKYAFETLESLTKFLKQELK